MPRAMRSILAVIAAMSASAAAHAMALAEVQVTGAGGEPIVSFTLKQGFAFEIDNDFPLNLGAGQTAAFDFDYTITLKDDGLVAVRPVPFCQPLSLSDCGPSPTGHELAYVSIFAGYRDGRSANPFVNVSGEGVKLQTDGGTFADSLTRSGTLHVHAAGTSDQLRTSQFSVWAFGLVDAVPEPGTYALLLAGLGIVGGMARRRSAAGAV